MGPAQAQMGPNGPGPAPNGSNGPGPGPNGSNGPGPGKWLPMGRARAQMGPMGRARAQPIQTKPNQVNLVFGNHCPLTFSLFSPWDLVMLHITFCDVM